MNIIVLAGIMFFIGIMFFTVWQHEQVHVVINDYAGIESEPVLALKDGYIPAVGIKQTTQPTKEIKEHQKLHIQNEIINYNLTTPLFGIMAILIGGFLYLGEKVSKND
jgi:hypothetical protein